MTVRAVILAMLVVVGVGALALAPPTTASDHIDEEIDDGEVYYDGQVLEQKDGVVNDNTYHLYRDGDSLREVRAEDGSLVIDTSEYTLNNDGDVRESDFTVKDTSGDELVSFTVRDETIDVVANSDIALVDQDPVIEYTVKSGFRVEFDVHVTSESITSDELASGLNAPDSSVEETDDGALITGVSRGEEISLWTNDFPHDTHDIAWDVTDVDASDNHELRVTDSPRGIATFNQGLYQENVGDIAEITLDLDDTDIVDVQIGTYIYEHTFTLRDTDDSGQVTFGFDTYIAGNGVQPVVTNSGTEVVDAGNDVDIQENTLPTESYDLIAEVDGEITDESLFNHRSMNSTGITTVTLPSSTTDLTKEELQQNSTVTDSVAVGDYLGVRVDTSSVFSALESDMSPDTINSNSEFADEHGFYLSFYSIGIGGHIPEQYINLEDAEELVMAPDENSFYVVFETDDFPVDEEPEDDREIEHMNDFVSEFHFNSNSKLVDDDDEVELKSELSLVQSTIIPTHRTDSSIVGSNPFIVEKDDEIDNHPITVETSLSPGTDVTLVVEDLRDEHITLGPETVTEDGFATFELDTSDIDEGEEFTARFEPTGDRHEFIVRDMRLPPTIQSINEPDVVYAEESADFTAEATDSEHSDLEYEWKLGNKTSTGVDFNHTFDESGEYDLKLNVTNPDGLSATESITVSVVEPPFPDLEADIKLAPGQPIFTETEFDVAAVEPAGIDDETDVVYTWDFDDGTIKQGQTVTHDFLVPTSYDVTVTVEADDGRSNSASTTVDVQQPHELVKTMYRFFFIDWSEESD